VQILAFSRHFTCDAVLRGRFNAGFEYIHFMYALKSSINHVHLSFWCSLVTFPAIR